MVIIVGLAAPFHETVRARDMSLWRFLPGAFAAAIARQRVDLIINHADPCPVIASTCDPDQTLHLWESADALLFRYTPNGAIGAAVLQYARQGAYVGASIGFRRRSSTSFDVDGGIVSFAEVDLVEISLVPRGVVPAFARTWVRVMTDCGRWQWAT